MLILWVPIYKMLMFLPSIHKLFAKSFINFMFYLIKSVSDTYKLECAFIKILSTLEQKEKFLKSYLDAPAHLQN